jgi:hypothetical protein
MNYKLNWREIKALYKLYSGLPINKGDKNNKNSIRNHPYFILLYKNGYIKDKIGNDKVFVKEENNTKYDEFYNIEFINEQNVLKYTTYLEFLQSINVNPNTNNLKEFDIQRLIEIKEFWCNEKLRTLRDQIINARENLQGVSKMFFKSTKYIANNPNRTSLETAVKSLIGIDEFIETDKQYIKPFHCKSENARITILCENFYYLKFPHYIEENEIELMYVGGYNVSRLANLVDVKLPIYYLCDWDYDGLKIYEKAKSIIDNLRNNQFKLILLTPNGKPEKISDTDEYHSSKWTNLHEYICGLKKEFYSEEQLNLIQHLIKEDEWIEEEGNSLEDIIKTIK